MVRKNLSFSQKLGFSKIGENSRYFLQCMSVVKSTWMPKHNYAKSISVTISSPQGSSIDGFVTAGC